MLKGAEIDFAGLGAWHINRGVRPEIEFAKQPNVNDKVL